MSQVQSLKKPPVRLRASGAASFEQAERQVIIDALKSRLRKNSGQGRGRRAPWAEANDTPKQDEQTEYQSRRLLRRSESVSTFWKPDLTSIFKAAVRSWVFEGGAVLPASRHCPSAGHSRP